MSNTPEKIWAIRKDGGNGGIYTTNENISTDDRLVEYIRADLVPQWMQIETAPKDGTTVLVGAYLYWHGWVCDMTEYGTGEWRCGFTPTHWQPLPNPPPAT